MDFQSTGLPNDRTIITAFLARERHARTPGAANLNTDLPIVAAQALNQNGVDNPSLLAATILLQMPPQTWGQLGQRFDDSVMGHLKSRQAHMATGLTYIPMADDSAKLITLAVAAASFDLFVQDVDKLQKDIQKNLENPDSKKPSTGIIQLPPPFIYERLGHRMLGTTSSPALETLFSEKLEAYREAFAALHQQMAAIGVIDEDDADMAIARGNGQGQPEYPDFGSSGLIETEDVRKAYEIITQHSFSNPAAVQAAVEAAQLLSNATSTPNPDAVALALIDLGMPHMTEEDLYFISKQISSDVMSVLGAHSQHMLDLESNLLDTPLAFRQVAVAAAIHDAGFAKQYATEVVEKLDSGQIAPASAVVGMLRQMSAAADIEIKTLTAVAATTGMPELAEIYAQRANDTKEFIDAAITRLDPPKAAKNPPAPRRKPGGGNSFSF